MLHAIMRGLVITFSATRTDAKRILHTFDESVVGNHCLPATLVLPFADCLSTQAQDCVRVFRTASALRGWRWRRRRLRRGLRRGLRQFGVPNAPLLIGSVVAPPNVQRLAIVLLVLPEVQTCRRVLKVNLIGIPIIPKSLLGRSVAVPEKNLLSI